MRVSISGQIVSNDDKWLYDYFDIPNTCPAEIRDAIEATPEGDTLTVEINSGGGDMFAGFEMYSILRQAACPTVAEVQSLAASAASTAMIGCDTVLLSPVAQVMIHMAITETHGNEDAHRESLRALESFFVSILNGYELKCGAKCDRATLERYVRQSTWIPVQDAVAMGLADGILGGGENLSMDVHVVNAASGIFGGLQTPTRGALLDEYHRRVANGAAPAEGHEIASAAGCIDIGKPGFLSDRTAAEVLAQMPAADNSPPTGESGEASVDNNWLDEAFVFIEQERFKFL